MNIIITIQYQNLHAPIDRKIYYQTVNITLLKIVQVLRCDGIAIRTTDMVKEINFFFL